MDCEVGWVGGGMQLFHLCHHCVGGGMHTIAGEDASCLAILPILSSVDDLALLTFQVAHHHRLWLASSLRRFRRNSLLPDRSDVTSFPLPELRVDSVAEGVSVGSTTEVYIFPFIVQFLLGKNMRSKMFREKNELSEKILTMVNF